LGALEAQFHLRPELEAQFHLRPERDPGSFADFGRHSNQNRRTILTG
jgi:hypothetical protein